VATPPAMIRVQLVQTAGVKVVAVATVVATVVAND
jgi:hypothetical protein